MTVDRPDRHCPPTPAARYHPHIVSPSPLRLLRPDRADGPFATFADHLLGRELPDLAPDRRDAAVAFVCRRVGALPSPLLAGVALLTAAVGIGQRLVGVDRITTFLQATRLPFVGEMARLVRSLGFTFVWETWPDTSPTGAPLVGAPR